MDQQKRIKLPEDQTILDGISDFVKGDSGLKDLSLKMLFVLALAVWIAVQGAFSLIPLWTRPLPPEVDDSMTYILKARQMEECFFQDCMALNDLKKQLLPPSKSKIVRSAKHLGLARVFPVYHPLHSVVMLVIKQFGFSLMDAFKIIWSLGPLFFGVAFAYLLYALWGLPAAATALFLTAFKVFPDTGIHHVVPSNITMGMAVIIWARIISKNGYAPWIMCIGSFLMMTMHPIGRLYAVMAVVMAWFLSEKGNRGRMVIPIVITILLVIAAFIIPNFIDRPLLANMTFTKAGVNPIIYSLEGAGQSLVRVISNLVRLQDGLFGHLGIFLAAIIGGIVVAEPDRARKGLIVIGIYLFFVISLFFLRSSHPADVIFRMWIPLVFILFGALATCVWYFIRESTFLIIDKLQAGRLFDTKDFKSMRPLVICAFLIGYVVLMTIDGAEQVYATMEHVKTNQPIMISKRQTEKLYANARDGDRVLYNSVIIMPYYFINGAMKLGAVYWHPDLKGSSIEKRWLARPDLRFAVLYNPFVYHPSFEGRAETTWWRTGPDFNYSPLNQSRDFDPVNRNGYIPIDEFRWFEIKINNYKSITGLQVFVDNPGRAVQFKITLINPIKKLTGAVIIRNVPENKKGWVDLDLNINRRAQGIRISFPNAQTEIKIHGLRFSSNGRYWPWDELADFTVMPRDPRTGPITVSFDPSKLVPRRLSRKKITVLDDWGSSVLLKLGP